MREASAEKDTQEMTSSETNDTGATVAAQGAHVASEKATAKKGAPKGQKKAKGGKAKAAAPKKAAKTVKKTTKSARAKLAKTPRAESKGAKILELIARTKGASLAEIMKATGWQAHSVRGFISTAGKKYGAVIESRKNEGGERLYQIVK